MIAEGYYSILQKTGEPSNLKRILVIGAKGMLGKDLMPTLHSEFPHDDIVGWDIEEIDIQNEEPSATQIEKFQPTIVILLAAYTDVDGCESNEEKAFAVNAEGAQHVAKAVSRCSAKMVYLSTDYVFDGNKREPYLENDAPHPLNAYGRSKLKGEKYVQKWAKDALIIRTQWLYGRYGKNFVDSILRQANEKKTLSIVNDQVGSPTYTVDLSEAISSLIKGDARGIFHVCNRDSCTWYEFGQKVLELSGINNVKVIPISSKELGRPAVRPSYSVFSSEKLRKETGFVLRSWSEALRDYLQTSEENQRKERR